MVITPDNTYLHTFCIKCIPLLWGLHWPVKHCTDTWFWDKKCVQVFGTLCGICVEIVSIGIYKYVSPHCNTAHTHTHTHTHTLTHTHTYRCVWCLLFCSKHGMQATTAIPTLTAPRAPCYQKLTLSMYLHLVVVAVEHLGVEHYPYWFILSVNLKFQCT